jgi:hypothetical protein
VLPKYSGIAIEGTVKTGTGSGMAGWASRVNEEQQSVSVTIHFYLDHLLGMAGCGALVP